MEVNLSAAARPAAEPVADGAVHVEHVNPFVVGSTSEDGAAFAIRQREIFRGFDKFSA
jgi:hypothetical protein